MAPDLQCAQALGPVLGTEPGSGAHARDPAPGPKPKGRGPGSRRGFNGSIREAGPKFHNLSSHDVKLAHAIVEGRADMKKIIIEDQAAKDNVKVSESQIL